MLQKMDLQQLQALSLDKLNTYKSQANARKVELEKLKTKGDKAWNDELQSELNDVVLFLVDIDDTIETKATKVKSSYIPKPGTEDMVHVSIVYGRRFNPLTGSEESTPFTQMFTFAEWQLFKKNFRTLGYTIMAALHDPYGDAAELVIKK